MDLNQAKADAVATKEVTYICPVTKEVKTQVVIDTDKAKKALNFMASLAFRRPS